MVVSDPETTSSRGGGDAELALQTEHQQKHNNNSTTTLLLSSLGRQSSIYSLTLDEFQHTLSESGKNFGSMNMDEFLNSIWTAEENQQQQPQPPNTAASSAYVNGDHHPHPEAPPSAAERGALVARQQSLTRQGSLTLPPPLCRKTVDEVWSEIHIKARVDETHQRRGAAAARGCNSETTPRQPTFGEMTLEDFLVKAGVVREQAPVSQPYGIYAPPGFAARPMASAAPAVAAAYPAAAFGEYAGNGVAEGGYGGPVSPVSSDGLCGGPADNGGAHFGLDMAVALRGRKRIIDGPVEKVVERRQRRMIKNRESAARSRARKQAYTVELEAELNQLREENSHLKQALAELERKQKQQYFEEMKLKVQTKAFKAKEKLRAFRRNVSCPL